MEPVFVYPWRSYYRKDPQGLFDEPGTDGCYYNGFWVPGCDIALGFGQSQQTLWAKAQGRIAVFQAIAIADLTPGEISSDCQKDIDALGSATSALIANGTAAPGTKNIDDTSLAVALANTDYENGLTATAPESTLNDPSITVTAGQPIKNMFGGATKAVAQLGGNIVYVDPRWLSGNGISPIYGAALVIHEALHNMGLNDPQVESALGLTQADCPGGSTDCITIKLEKDCTRPPSPIILGGP